MACSGTALAFVNTDKRYLHGHNSTRFLLIPYHHESACSVLCWTQLLATSNEELYNLYSSPDIIRQIKSRRMGWAGHVAGMGGEKSVQGFGGKARTLGRPRRMLEDGIRMDIRDISLGSVDWIRLAQDRDWWRAAVSAVRNLRVLALLLIWQLPYCWQQI
jgi:hypothetical protein